MKYRTELEERLTEEICDEEANYVLDFLDIRCEFESRVASKLEGMSYNEFVKTWDKYMRWSIEDEIAEIEDGE